MEFWTLLLLLLSIHTAEPSMVPEVSSFEGETTTEILKRYKLPGLGQILAELIQAGCQTLNSEIHKLFILSGISIIYYADRRLST
jgi:hypothetical protein